MCAIGADMRVIPPRRKLSYLDLTMQAPSDVADEIRREVDRLMATGLSRTGPERSALAAWAKATNVAPNGPRA